MASLESAIMFVAAVLLGILTFTFTTKRHPTSVTAFAASFAIGLSSLPTLIGLIVWMQVLNVLMTRGLAFFAFFNDFVIGLPFLFAPFVLLISMAIFLDDRDRRQNSHLAVVPLGFGMAISVIGTAVLFFLATMASTVAEA